MELYNRLLSQSKLLVEDIDKDEETIFYTVVDHEKLVRLVLQECRAALSPMLRDMISRGDAVNLISEHFGLERNENE